MNPSSKEEETSKEVGKRGERWALRYLYSQGFDVLERNYRCRLGEIDLIAWDGPSLAFLEVKTRSSGEIAPALEALEEEQKARIHRAAAYYRKTRKLESCLYRFDLVAIDIRSDGRPDIRLIRNAF